MLQKRTTCLQVSTQRSLKYRYHVVKLKKLCTFHRNILLLWINEWMNGILVTQCTIWKRIWLIFVVNYNKFLKINRWLKCTLGFNQKFKQKSSIIYNTLVFWKHFGHRVIITIIKYIHLWHKTHQCSWFIRNGDCPSR